MNASSARYVIYGLGLPVASRRACIFPFSPPTSFHIPSGPRFDRPRQSGYRGVYPHKPTGRWIAQISAGGHVRHLGIFDDPIAAARSYDLAARAQWDQFTRTNGFA